MTPKPLLSTLLAACLVTLAAPLVSAGEGGHPGEGCQVILDVLFVFDTTGSMGSVITDAKNGATAVMSAVQAQSPGAQFGVADYKDYRGTYAYPGYMSTYGGPGDYPWRLVQPLTPSTAAAQGAINVLSASGGYDTPESLTRAVFESYSDPGIGWRSGSTRVVVLFTDAPAHDLNFNGQNTGGDPGRNAVAGDADDLDFELTAATAGAKGLRIAGVGVGWNGGAAYLQHLATATDGTYAPLGGDFVTQITNMILELAGVTIEAHADAVLVDVTSYASYNLDVTHVEAGPHTDAHQETLQTIILPNALNGYLKTGDGSATVVRGPTEHAAAEMTIQEVSLLNGLIRANLLHADAVATASGGWASGDASGSYVAEVIVNNIPVTLTPGVFVPLPGGLGYVAVNEQIVHQPAPDSVEVEANAIHLRLTLPDFIADVKIAHAFAIISCQPSGHDDGPHDPVDPQVPEVPGDPIGPIGPVRPPPVSTPCIQTPWGVVCVDETICVQCIVGTGKW